MSLFSGNTKNDSKLGALIFGIPGLIGVSEDCSFVQHSAFSAWLNFKEGVIVSNEPGYYEKGSFGIRLETVLVTIKKNDLPYGK